MSVNPQNTNTKLDAGRFEDLHYAYHDRLLSSMTAMVRDREAAQEITASAFAKALQYLATFRGEASFYTWLQAIAANEARRWRRDGDVPLERLTDAEITTVALRQPGKVNPERAGEAERARRALRSVPRMYRQVLIEHVIHEHSMKEIARKYRIPLGTALSRTFKAKRLLRQAWERVR